MDISSNKPSKKRVLFIDDDLKLWENSFKEELDEFDLRGEENPDLAIKVINEFNPNIVLLDILFLDPNGDDKKDGYRGGEILKKIKDKYPNLPVIMLTTTMNNLEFQGNDYTLADGGCFKSRLEEGDFCSLISDIKELIKKAEAGELRGKKESICNKFFIVGRTKEMQDVARIIEKISDTVASVLITGEGGTGKELIARALHDLSPKRKSQPFIDINCPAIPADLLESEFFGHEKGSFTDAHNKKSGKFEDAGKGTIFLDEIGDMPINLQAKLLRVLQEKQFISIGGKNPIHMEARVIAATNKELEKGIQDGSFRQDLYYRLNVITIRIPPLRQRKEDLEILFKHFVNKHNKDYRKNIFPELRDDVKRKFMFYPWPGNIREMENKILSAMLKAKYEILLVEDFDGLGELDRIEPWLSNLAFEIAERIYYKDMTWDNFWDAFKKTGKVGAAVFQLLQNKFEFDYGYPPSDNEMKDLLQKKNKDSGCVRQLKTKIKSRSKKNHKFSK